jgi:ribosomal-protein-alanine N-acetyltransferase
VTAVETARLYLRPWQEADLDDLVGLYSDAEVMRHISGGRPFSRQRVERMLAHTLRQWRDRGFGPWAAIDKATGTWIGEIGLNEIPDWPDAHNIEVGWELHRAWWGRGLAPEGGRAALWFGFTKHHHLEQIISVTRPDNAASRRVMDKIGLIYQGTRPYREAEAVWYALDRPTWETSPEGRRAAINYAIVDDAVVRARSEYRMSPTRF